jgi:ankyrin repeat protein
MRRKRLPVRTTAGVLAVVAILLSGCFLCPARPGAYGPIDVYTLNDDAAKVTDDLRVHPADIKFRDNAGRTPLHLAAQRCRLSVLPVLLAAGADPNSVAQGGATPLHLAAQEGCEKAVVLLLAAHANLNARDEAGRTPLVRAEQWHQDVIVKLLAEHGALR